jgi:hypothetical protein
MLLMADFVNCLFNVSVMRILPLVWQKRIFYG